MHSNNLDEVHEAIELVPRIGKVTGSFAWFGRWQ